MHIWQKLILSLIVLWLPVQGISATFIPLSCHTHDHDTQVEAAHDAHHHAPMQHAEQGKSPAQHVDKHCLNCASCTLCQISSALALPASLHHPLPAPVADYRSAPLAPLHSFIPALLDKPPRSLAA